MKSFGIRFLLIIKILIKKGIYCGWYIVSKVCIMFKLL